MMLRNLNALLLLLALSLIANATVMFKYVQIKVRDDLDPPTSQILRILEGSFKGIYNNVILHDGSPQASKFLLGVTSSRAMRPSQIGLMTHYLESNSSLNFGREHNRHMGLVIVAFEDKRTPENFLTARGSTWVRGSMLFVNLNVGIQARSLLRLASNVEKISLLEGSVDKQGRLSYTFKSYFPFSHQQYPKYTVETARPLTREQIFQERFPNFGGLELHLASWVDDFPILFYADGNNTTAIGLAINLLEEIKQKLNFSYSVQDLPPDGMWGDLVNGSWVGMAGQLVRKEKDIVANSFAVLHERYLAMDFTVPIFYDSYSAVLKLPPPPPRYLGAVYPFSNWVWFAVVISLVFITLIFLTFQKTRFCLYDKGDKDIVWLFLWLGRGLLRQSVPGEPKSSVLRIVLGVWWLCTLVLSSSYFGNLIAYITIPDEPHRIRTLEELARSHHKLFMLDYGAPLPNYLTTSVDPVLSLLGQKLTLAPSYEEIEEEVLESKGVIIEGTNYMAYEIAGWPGGDLYYVREVLYPSFYAWAFQKDTPWIHRFDKYLVMMIERGLVSKWRKDIVAEFQRSRGLSTGRAVTSKEETKRRPLSLTDLQAAFIVLGLGCILSACVFFLQMIPRQLKTDSSACST